MIHIVNHLATTEQNTFKHLRYFDQETIISLITNHYQDNLVFCLLVYMKSNKKSPYCIAQNTDQGHDIKLTRIVRPFDLTLKPKLRITLAWNYCSLNHCIQSKWATTSHALDYVQRCTWWYHMAHPPWPQGDNSHVLYYNARLLMTRNTQWCNVSGYNFFLCLVFH